MQNTQRRIRAAFRISSLESVEIDKKIAQTNLGKSEFIRRAVMGVPIHSVTDKEMVTELKRLGALMKYQYPKHSNWTDPEKREYWLLMEKLNGLASQLQSNMLKGQ